MVIKLDLMVELVVERWQQLGLGSELKECFGFVAVVTRSKIRSKLQIQRRLEGCSTLVVVIQLRSKVVDAECSAAVEWAVGFKRLAIAEVRFVTGLRISHSISSGSCSTCLR